MSLPRHFPSSHVHTRRTLPLPVRLSLAILVLLVPGVERKPLAAGLRRLARPLSFSEVSSLRHTGAGVFSLPKLHRPTGRRGVLGAEQQGWSGSQALRGVLEGIRSWFGSHAEESGRGGSVGGVSSGADEVTSEASGVSNEASDDSSKALAGAGAKEPVQRKERRGAPPGRGQTGSRRGLKARKTVRKTRRGKRRVRRGQGKPKSKKKSPGGTSGAVKPVASPSSVLKYLGGPVATAPINVHLISLRQLDRRNGPHRSYRPSQFH